jgi:hypothetical protein
MAIFYSAFENAFYTLCTHQVLGYFSTSQFDIIRWPLIDRVKSYTNVIKLR